PLAPHPPPQALPGRGRAGKRGGAQAGRLRSAHGSRRRAVPADGAGSPGRGGVRDAGHRVRGGRAAARAGAPGRPDRELGGRGQRGPAPQGAPDRRQGLVARQAEDAQGHPGDDGRAAGAVRRLPGGTGVRLCPRHPLAARDGVGVPVRGHARPAPGHRGRQARHGVAAPHGPADLRRRGLRQDRDRHPRRLQGRAGRKAGGGARAHDHPGRAAPAHLPRAPGRLSGEDRGPVALSHGEGAGQGAGAAGGGRGRHPGGNAPPAFARREVSRPRAAGDRRGAALRREAQGDAEAAAPQRGRADAHRHAHPAHPALFAAGAARHDADPDAAARPAAGDHPRAAVDRRHPGRRHPARAGPGRTGVLRPQPGGDDRRRRAEGAGAGVGRAHRGGARADARKGARGGDDPLPGGRGRRAGGHGHHRGGAGRSPRQHADRQPGGLLRPQPAVPDPRAGGPQPPPGVLLPAGARRDPGRRRKAAAGAGALHRAGERLPHRAQGHGAARRRQHPGAAAVGLRLGRGAGHVPAAAGRHHPADEGRRRVGPRPAGGGVGGRHGADPGQLHSRRGAEAPLLPAPFARREAGGDRRPAPRASRPLRPASRRGGDHAGDGGAAAAGGRAAHRAHPGSPVGRAHQLPAGDGAADGVASAQPAGLAVRRRGAPGPAAVADFDAPRHRAHHGHAGFGAARPCRRPRAGGV
ncbi:MAG: Transcription-repair coupling factor, partial [uncultured Gemmatimonadetes bacterium]